MRKLSLVEYKVPVYKAQHESVWIKHLKVSIKKKNYHSLNVLFSLFSFSQLLCSLLYVLMHVSVCNCLLDVCCGSVVALETIHSIQLMLLVREATEPNSSFSGTAAPAWVGDGVTDTAILQPACITAVIAQQLPGSIHLANLGNLSTIFLACPDCLIIGQLKGLDQVVETT